MTRISQRNTCASASLCCSVLHLLIFTLLVAVCSYVLNERWKDKKGVPTHEIVARRAAWTMRTQRTWRRQALEENTTSASRKSTSFLSLYAAAVLPAVSLVTLRSVSDCDDRDGGNIITYPRDVPGTVRRKDEKRKESRKRKQEQDAIAAQQQEAERQARLAKILEELESPDCKLSEKEKKQRYLEAFVESVAADDKVEDVRLPFSYTDVQANTFGMTMRDILDASDSELDVYVPIRGLAPYREKEWKPKFTARPKLGWQKRLERKQKEKSEQQEFGGEADRQWQDEGLDEDDNDAHGDEAGAADDHERQRGGQKERRGS